MIKDSGERREFETGAIRDICEGKGRCDLLPLDVVCKLLPKYDPVLTDIGAFINYGTEGNLLDAIIHFCMDDRTNYQDIYDLLLDVSVQFEEGVVKYGESNWRKGIPTHCYIDSAIRHYLKFLRGDTDESHDRAFVWNLMCCVWTCRFMPNLKEYPISEIDG